MRYREYWAEIDAICSNWLEERSPGDGSDEFSDWLHETLDGHEFVIYTRQSLEVMLHTDSPNAWEDYGFEAGPMFDAQRAYAAMYADVLGRLDYDPDDLDDEGDE